MDITLQWKWLKYDIDQETQKFAKSLITNDPSGELTMEAQIADDIFDLDYCKRKITEGCMKLQDALHKYFAGIKIYKISTQTITDVTYSNFTPSGISALKVGDRVNGTYNGSTITMEVISLSTSVSLRDISTSGSPINYSFSTTTLTPVVSGAPSISNVKWLKKIETTHTEDAITIIETAANDTLLHEADNWVITLDNFGSRRNINQTLLANELHQYIVLYVLQEWTKLTHPTMEQNYVNRFVAEENRILSIVNRKEAPNRPE